MVIMTNEKPIKGSSNLIEGLIQLGNEIGARELQSTVTDKNGSLKIECRVTLEADGDTKSEGLTPQDSDRDVQHLARGNVKNGVDIGDDIIRCPVADCDNQFESEHGMRIHYSKIHESENGPVGDSIRDNLKYKDPNFLRELYDQNDTFAEMAEQAEEDISASTIRRHMIDYGIHEPKSYNISSEKSGNSSISDGGGNEVESLDEVGGLVESPEGINGDLSDSNNEVNFQNLLRGLGIKKEINLDELKTTVSESDTILETSNHLGIPKDKTRDLLLEMDLIDAVLGRLSEKEKREISIGEIDERIRAKVG